jgi:hypothetical protein
MPNRTSTPLAVPTLHLNGTSPERLVEQNQKLVAALRSALDALQEAAPHGRDYYVQGPDAYAKAAAEHRARQEALSKVFDEAKDIQRALFVQRAR